MRRTAWLQETRMARFEEAFFGWTESRLTQEEAGPDNCVRFQRRGQQIPPGRYRCHYVKATVTVRHHRTVPHNSRTNQRRHPWNNSDQA